MDLKHYASRYIALRSAAKGGWRDALVGRFVKKGARVLDVGCASGAFWDKWGADGIAYSGVDYNGHFVDHCKAKGLDARRCDLSREPLPFPDGSFDLAYCSHVLEHLLSNEQVAFFQECSRVLAPGGTLVLFTPTPYHWYFWDDHTHQRPSTHGSLSGLALDAGLAVAEAKYSLARWAPQRAQKWLRLPPLRWFLWETYLVASKPR